MPRRLVFPPPEFRVPEALDALIAACLEKDRARRPRSAEAVVEALDRLASRLAWTQLDAADWWSQYRKRRQAAPASTVAASEDFSLAARRTGGPAP